MVIPIKSEERRLREGKLKFTRWGQRFESTDVAKGCVVVFLVRGHTYASIPPITPSS